MKYTLFTTHEFEKDFQKLDYSLQQQIEDALESIQCNPSGGKPLSYPYFREKKVRKYRIYYLIYSDYVVVFVVGLSNKKNQQHTIDKIRKLVPKYMQIIKDNFS